MKLDQDRFYRRHVCSQINVKFKSRETLKSFTKRMKNI